MKALKPFSGIFGFDCNESLSGTTAAIMRDAGYRFAVRYIRRAEAHSHDLSRDEIEAIHSAGLGLSIVQHVESESAWTPSGDKGDSYGATAANAVSTLGLPQGITVWCDLEGVAEGVPSTAVIAYCNAWATKVAGAGYQPGLYVGWHSGLSANELYYRLKFQRYWAAYNLNSDQYPAVRGVCMKQMVAQSPAGSGLIIDSDRIVADHRGDLPTLAFPDEWVA